MKTSRSFKYWMLDSMEQGLTMTSWVIKAKISMTSLVNLQTSNQWINLLRTSSNSVKSLWLTCPIIKEEKSSSTHLTTQSSRWVMETTMSQASKSQNATAAKRNTRASRRPSTVNFAHWPSAKNAGIRQRFSQRVIPLKGETFVLCVIASSSSEPS